MYCSTRGGEQISASLAIIKGIADNGGLFAPTSFPVIDYKQLQNKDYKEVAFVVLRAFLDDFSDEEIRDAIELAYGKDNFSEKIVGLTTFADKTFLELYHGRTLAFKDMALSILPRLMAIAKTKISDKSDTTILAATSGDTGGATLSGFSGVEGFSTIVVYPKGGVSVTQEKQMKFYCGKKAQAYAYEGNFDDCQTLVKKIFAEFGSKARLSSANSINIGRLIPQIVYYFYSYCRLVGSGVIADGDKINVCVPTGNFGDILAAYYAKKCSLPIEKLVCASNSNDVLTEFFATGRYNAKRPFHKTNSPSMDILVSSNLERLLYLVTNNDSEQVVKLMEQLKANGEYTLKDEFCAQLADFVAVSCPEGQTLRTIREVFDEYKYLIDPHTAVGYYAFTKCPSENHTLIVSTASPYKFTDAIAQALRLDCEESGDKLDKVIQSIFQKTNVCPPKVLSEIAKTQRPTITLSAKQLLNRVLGRADSVRVLTPASCANLGCGFDCAAIAVDLFNSFVFTANEGDKLIGFDSIDLKDNLVLNSYKRFFDNFKLEYIPVTIQLERQDIPQSRGLGSSASCIVAGLLGANYMSGGVATREQILDLACLIEGHGDNVGACLNGDLAVTVPSKSGLLCAKYAVHADLCLTALIPDFTLSTALARRALPDSLSYDQAVNNIGGCLLLPLAFGKGDVGLIARVFQDRLHQPYRLPLITGGEQIKTQAEQAGFACCVSGAGATMLVVGRKYYEQDKNGRFVSKKLKVNEIGSTTEEL